MAKLLSLMHIRDVHLDDRTFQRTDAVVQGNAGMGIGTCIQHDAVIREAHFLHLIDQLTLHVALKVVYLYVRVSALQLRQVSLKRLAAIDARLPASQQVQVRSVNNLYLHCPNTIFGCKFRHFFREYQSLS